MSENKYFIFKTALPKPTYIGYDFKPDENSVAYGIKFTTIPEGNILYNGLDKNDCKLLIIENPKANIKTLKEFDNNYKPPTLTNMPVYQEQYSMTGIYKNDNPYASNATLD